MQRSWLTVEIQLEAMSSAATVNPPALSCSASDPEECVLSPPSVAFKAAMNFTGTASLMWKVSRIASCWFR